MPRTRWRRMLVEARCCRPSRTRAGVSRASSPGSSAGGGATGAANGARRWGAEALLTWQGTDPRRIRVVAVGAHSASKAELRNGIGAQPDIEIVADTPDAPPDVTVLDAAALSAGLVETIERIRRQHPPARVLVLTTHDTPGCLEAALAAGATGYVLTPAADQELLAAIRAVHRGRTFVDIGRPDGLGR